MDLYPWLTQIKALGWDLDGTLYPPNPELTALIHAEQRGAVAAKMGWDSARTDREYTRRYRELGSNTKTMISFGIDGVAFYTGFWDRVNLARFIRRDERLVRLFEKLRGIRHFLISNSNRKDQIEQKLRLLGLRPRIFELIVSTVDVGAVKPDPGPFLAALEKLELSPEQCLFIGDRVTTDIMGARGVGMRTCLVWGDAPEADVSLATVYDVEKLWTNSKLKAQSSKVQLKR